MAARPKPVTDAPARQPLSRERILRAALSVADRDGLDAVTMRRLARELDSGPMSLYRHVRDRDDLVDGVAQLVASEIEAPDTDDWREYAREAARAVYWIGHIHPKVFGPLVARPTATRDPHMFAIVGGLLQRLVAGGLDEHQALLATRTLANFLIGAVLSDVIGRLELPGGAVDARDEFETGLETVLRGIAAGLPG